MWRLIISLMLAFMIAQPVATAQDSVYQPPGDTGVGSERASDSATDGYPPYSSYELGAYPPGIDYATGGYPPERQIDRPGAVEHDLNNSFPKRDSLFPNLVPQRWSDFKTKLYEEHGLKLATSYQSHLLHASDVLSGKHFAAGGFFLLEGKWDVYGRGEDHQGGVVASVTNAHGYGNAAEPFTFFTQTGSALPHDVATGGLGWYIRTV